MGVRHRHTSGHGGTCPICLFHTDAAHALASHLRRHVREGVLVEERLFDRPYWRLAHYPGSHTPINAGGMGSSKVRFFDTWRDVQRRFWEARHVSFHYIPGMVEGLEAQTQERQRAEAVKLELRDYGDGPHPWAQIKELCARHGIDAESDILTDVLVHDGWSHFSLDDVLIRVKRL